MTPSVLNACWSTCVRNETTDTKLHTKRFLFSVFPLVYFRITQVYSFPFLLCGFYDGNITVNINVRNECVLYVCTYGKKVSVEKGKKKREKHRLQYLFYWQFAKVSFFSFLFGLKTFTLHPIRNSGHAYYFLFIKT